MCLVRGWPKITTQSCEEKQGQQEQRWGFRPQLKTLRPGDPLNNCPPPLITLCLSSTSSLISLSLTLLICKMGVSMPADAL